MNEVEGKGHGEAVASERSGSTALGLGPVREPSGASRSSVVWRLATVTKMSCRGLLSPSVPRG